MNIAALDSLPCDTPGCSGLASRLVARDLPLPDPDEYYAPEDQPESDRDRATSRSVRSMLCEGCCRRVFGWAE